MAQGASRFVVRQEPLVEAGAVVLVLEAVVAGVENAVTYWPHLHALNSFIEIVLPRAHRLCYRAFLQREMISFVN